MNSVPLSAYTTMKLGGTARYLVQITTRQEIAEAVAWAEEHKVPHIMIGGGSNLVWSDKGFSGLVIVNGIAGFELFEEDADNAYVTVGAGEDWDSVVERTVTAGWHGLENLSLIPGTAGATPVQNVGAYGAEIADVLVSVEVYDLEKKTFVVLPNSDCNFGYRTSRFKAADKGRFYISGLTIHLTRENPKPPFYSTLQGYLSDNGITTFTPKVIRDAVIAIRRSKLPDVKLVANNGSFFANPVISSAEFIDLQAQFPDVVHWEVDKQHVKLSAAWLVEQAGFKDVHDKATGMATWKNQALVLVNERAEKTAQLITFRDRIIEVVKKKFGVELTQEPEILGDN